MGDILCLLTGMVECDPQAGSPCRVRWLVTLIQACVSAGKRKQYFYSTGLFQKLCKVLTSTFALAQTHGPQNTTQHPLTRQCDHTELLTRGSPSRHLGASTLHAWGQNRGLLGLWGERGHRQGHGHKALRWLPWCVQDIQELQKKGCHRDQLNYGGIKH